MTKHRLRGPTVGLITALTAVAVALSGCGSDASSGASAGSGPIQIWEGYTGAEAKAFTHLVSEYEAQNPGQKAAFDSAAGLASLQTLRTMAVTDKSMYLDPTDSSYANLFNSGKLGMVVTGPWDLSAFPNVKYGVQVMPSYPGTSGAHQTISGPDNWVVFNNGATQVSAAEKFLIWLDAPAQVKYFSLATGNLPIRASVAQDASLSKQMDAALPDVSTFTTNLTNVKQARPQISLYPKVSTILGTMIVSVLLGKSQPQAALDTAAQQVNAALAG